MGRVVSTPTGYFLDYADPANWSQVSVPNNGNLAYIDGFNFSNSNPVELTSNVGKLTPSLLCVGNIASSDLCIFPPRAPRAVTLVAP